MLVHVQNLGLKHRVGDCKVYETKRDYERIEDRKQDDDAERDDMDGLPVWGRGVRRIF